MNNSASKLVFAETRPNGTAVMLDPEVLRDNGTTVEAVKSQLESARRTGGLKMAHVVFRAGMHVMTEEQLEQRARELQEQGHDVGQFSRALECLQKRKAGGAAPAIPAQTARI